MVLSLSSVMMSEVNRAALSYALRKVYDEEPTVDDLFAFINDYEDYERNSWLTTQE